MYLLASGELGDAMALIKLYGPTFVAVIFFLWRDYRREDRMTARIDALQQEQREVLLPLVKDSTAVIAKNTVVIERLENHLLERVRGN
jgi:hypothetical protein